LTAEERKDLESLIDAKKAARYKRRHAEMLLLADQGPRGPGWPDARIAQAFRVHRTTLERLRQRFVEEGLDRALEHQNAWRTYRHKIDGEAEAHLIATVCGPAPRGRKRWTLQLLADQLVRLGVVEKVSYGTVRRALKKTS
jgi:hypothetical protein